MEDPEHFTRISRLTLQNKKEGFFKYLIDNLIHVVNIHQFSVLSTDLERVSYCAQRCWNLVGAELIFKGKIIKLSKT